ncbi:MAG: hypothetical protein GY820_14235 [Gammaproteobacteria bacterium]|nr:hypothetical protein [Gammaproteobacteria bacterium]
MPLLPLCRRSAPQHVLQHFVPSHSLLPIVSKEMERIILSILLPHVNKSFPDFQYGFRRGKSTVDCLSFVRSGSLY